MAPRLPSSVEYSSACLGWGRMDIYTYIYVVVSSSIETYRYILIYISM